MTVEVDGTIYYIVRAISPKPVLEYHSKAGQELEVKWWFLPAAQADFDNPAHVDNPIDFSQYNN